MWSSAPDDLCVGTGLPAAGLTAGRAGRAGGRRSPDRGTTLTDLWRIPIVRTSRGVGPPGSFVPGRPGACPPGGFMGASRPPDDELPLGTDGYPAASGVARRPAGA